MDDGKRDTARSRLLKNRELLRWHPCCSLERMIAVLILLGCVAAGIAIGLLATAQAPVGYQDETGFHYGPEHAHSGEEFACGVSQPRLAQF